MRMTSKLYLEVTMYDSEDNGTNKHSFRML